MQSFCHNSYINKAFVLCEQFSCDIPAFSYHLLSDCISYMRTLQFASSAGSEIFLKKLKNILIIETTTCQENNINYNIKSIL